MSSRPGAAGATRTCPHCKTVILDSAARCPACQHFIKLGAAPGSPIVARHAVQREATTTALEVEGRIRHPSDGGAWEYSVVLTIRDDEGKEIARQVVGVGAMFAGEERTFNLSVEVMPTSDMRRPAKRSRH